MKRIIQSTLSLSLAAALFPAAMLPQAATAEIRHVKTSRDGGTAQGDGKSWNTASNDLQKMINESRSNDEVWVFAGIYKPKRTANEWNSINIPTSYPTTDGERNNAFVLKGGVKIYGGFTSPVPEGAVPEFGTTGRDGTSTLSGDLDDVPGISDGDAFHVVIAAGIGDGAEVEGPEISAATVLDGFTITGGNAGEANSGSIKVNGQTVGEDSGGGIINIYSSPVLTHLVISGNHARSNGGGMYNNSSSPTLINVLISGNSAAAGGGGIYNTGTSNATLINVTISGNNAATGGGIYNNDESSPGLTGTIVWGNSNTNVYNGGSLDPKYRYSLVQGINLAGKDNSLDGTGETNSPRFVHPIAPSSTPTADGDYRLQTTTRIIDKGDNDAYLEAFTPSLPGFDGKTDLAGDPRLYGDNIDLGAYECAPFRSISINPSADHVFDPATFGYTNQTPLTVTVTNTGNMPTGALTVKPGGKNASSFIISDNKTASGIDASYDGQTFKVAPAGGLGVGTYNATVTVGDGNDISSLNFGVRFTVDKATPALSDLNYTPPAAVTYNGQPQPFPITRKTAGIGDITVYYNGHTAVPVDAGTYTITVSIAANANYDAATLSFGSDYVINPITPTIDDLDFHIGNINYDGRPHPVDVAAVNGVEGLGDITVYYNGSTTPPVNRGTYAVTIDMAPGVNYGAVPGMALGLFTILDPPSPLVRFRVQIPAAEGMATHPPAGTYYVGGNTDFAFTLTLDAPSLDGTLPRIRTNRANVPAGSDLRITPNSDGSYTVIIIDILQHIDLTLSAPTDNESVADASLELYAAPGAIVVANSRPDAATLHVYSLTGALIRLTNVPPGTTRIPVTPGVYMVTDGSSFRRKTVVIR
ncbi:MAG: MBG domain-containing protein [Tannerella sp.]|jgi:hypothetical protein|nr:MBG domain-containing protein [Tannerella sp.]